MGCCRHLRRLVCRLEPGNACCTRFRRCYRCPLLLLLVLLVMIMLRVLVLLALNLLRQLLCC
jgi:hypothetical protein